MTLGLPDRIESKISPEPNSGCWLWTGRLNLGYGRIRWNKRKQYAHRVTYELLKGRIQKGLHIDHLCRVRCCVNPDHMEPVTIVENVMRGISFSVINKAKTHCVHGHEFTRENTFVKDSGERLCRACNRRSALASYYRNKK